MTVRQVMSCDCVFNKSELDLSLILIQLTAEVSSAQNTYPARVCPASTVSGG